MKHEEHELWTELAFDPARQQRIAEAARNQTMGCFWSELTSEARRWLRSTFVPRTH